jgi:hypothetical protein
MEPAHEKSRSLQAKILLRWRAACTQTWRDPSGEEIGLCMGRGDRTGFHHQTQY